MVGENNSVRRTSAKPKQSANSGRDEFKKHHGATRTEKIAGSNWWGEKLEAIKEKKDMAAHA